MLTQRAEKHIIDRQSKWYSMLREKCHEAKNIYNHGNYLIRQEFIFNNRWIRYEELEQLVKTNNEYPDYWKWELANSSQQVLRRLDSIWKSYFAAINDWKLHPDKYTGMPKIPKYLKKDGYTEFKLTTNQVKLKADNLIHFPKSMNGFTLRPYFLTLDNFVKFNCCSIVPSNERIEINLIYTIEIKDICEQNNIVASIDLGVSNFAAIVDNLGNTPILINGKGLKSVNQYYNKKIAQIKSNLSKQGIKGYTHQLYSITNKRNDKIEYFMHCASTFVVQYCKDIGITTLIVGKNDKWKTTIRMDNKDNQQNFQYIPYNSFISKLEYKCQEAGIKFIQVSEAYTSGTSFFDNEPATEEFYNKERRFCRGLFRTNSGRLINADVNAAYQIMKNAFHDVEIPVDRGLVMNPVKVSLQF